MIAPCQCANERTLLLFIEITPAIDGLAAISPLLTASPLACPFMPYFYLCFARSIRDTELFLTLLSTAHIASCSNVAMAAFICIYILISTLNLSYYLCILWYLLHIITVMERSSYLSNYKPITRAYAITKTSPKHWSSRHTDLETLSTELTYDISNVVPAFLYQPYIKIEARMFRHRRVRIDDGIARYRPDDIVISVLPLCTCVLHALCWLLYIYIRYTRDRSTLREDITAGHGTGFLCTEVTEVSGIYQGVKF